MPGLNGHASERRAPVWITFLGPHSALGHPKSMLRLQSLSRSSKNYVSNTDFMSGPEHAEINKTEYGTAQNWVGADLEINNYLTVYMEQRMTNSVKEEETKEQIVEGNWEYPGTLAGRGNSKCKGRRSLCSGTSE